MIRSLFLATAATTALLPALTLAQEAEESFGGASGADLSIEAPTSAAICSHRDRVLQTCPRMAKPLHSLGM